VNRKLDHGTEQGVYVEVLVFRRAWPGKIQELREQTVEPLRLLINDFEALLVFRLEIGVPPQNAGSAGYASQRVPEFVGQTGRKLANCEQTLSAFHLLKILL
jgi:hypothetical protein